MAKDWKQSDKGITLFSSQSKTRTVARTRPGLGATDGTAAAGEASSTAASLQRASALKRGLDIADEHLRSQPSSFRAAKRARVPEDDGGQRQLVETDANDTAGEAAGEVQEQGGGDAAASAEDDAAITFRNVGLSEWLDNVCKSLGITEPTDVQRACIPAILQGRDVIGIAHTGSGKTAAFCLPLLQQLARDPYGVFALVMTPTRELAMQIWEQFRAFSAGMTLRNALVIGGNDSQAQARELAQRPHVVIATPGRLSELLSNDPSLAKGFSRLRAVVLDEADRLLDASLGPQLRSILHALPAQRQSLLFSATMTQDLIQLQKLVLRDAHVFEAYNGLVTAQRLREQYCFMPAKVKDVYLYHLLTRLELLQVRSAIVFAGTCKGCHLLGLALEELGLRCAVLHSHKPQAQRTRALQQFKGGVVPLLLATDVASRGLDIPAVDLVVNYDMPTLARDYVHRVGRTARAGRQGWSLSLVTQYEVDLVHQIEALTKRALEEYPMEEGEVLQSITKVYTAKRSAALRMVDEEALGRTYRQSGWKKKKDIQQQRGEGQ